MRLSFSNTILMLVFLPTLLWGADPNGIQFPPERVQAANKVLDTERSGHAAPFIGDIDGDGKPDLLVGEFYRGRMWIYKNIGKLGAPKFAEREPLIASGTQACIEPG